MGRKKHIEARIEPGEIERLRALIAKEEELEQEMRQDVREAIMASDKKLIRELHRLENKNRRLLMWIGVIVFMLMIVGFWVSRFDSLITRPLSQNDQPQNFNLPASGADMQATVQEVLKNIEEIKAQAKKLEEVGSASSSAPVFSGGTKLP